MTYYTVLCVKCFNLCVLFAVPHANVYIMVNPVRLQLDYLTVVWLNAFALNLLKRAVSSIKRQFANILNLWGYMTIF